MQQHLYPWKLLDSLRTRPNVGQLMDLCEENYRRLLQLAPRLAQMQGQFVSDHQQQPSLMLEILEQSPYTTLVHLTYRFDARETTRPDAVLRVYHDAAQLEVIALRESHLVRVNAYEHPGLLLKWKANVFIGKWLSYCRSQGHLFGLDPLLTAPA